MYEHRFTVSTDEELKEMLKDEKYIREYANYIILDGMAKREAYIKTFRMDTPLTKAHEVRMYRWFKKDVVAKWVQKANKSLEVDWIDKKVDVLNRMHHIAMDTLKDMDGNKIDVPLKLQATAGKDWLDAIKADKTINVNMGDNQTLNIVQIVQDKLESITSGSTIQPDMPMIEAEIE